MFCLQNACKHGPHSYGHLTLNDVIGIRSQTSEITLFAYELCNISNINVTGEAYAGHCRGICINSSYEGSLKIYRPSVRETRDKWPLGRESDRSWCHRHIKSVIPPFWSLSMAPCAPAAAYE